MGRSPGHWAFALVLGGGIIATPATVRATILSLFTFGSGANPDFTADVDNAVGTPSLVQAGGSVDATGATTGAVAFTDADGNPHTQGVQGRPLHDVPRD